MVVDAACGLHHFEAVGKGKEINLPYSSGVFRRGKWSFRDMVELAKMIVT